MHFLLIACLVAVAAAQIFPSGGTTTRSASVLVRRVVDAETIEVETLGRVRLLGIAVPGVAERRARQHLESLVLRRWVWLERDGDIDRPSAWGVAYVVREDGLFVNAALVGEGLARVRRPPASMRGAELGRAEREARGLRRGIWAVSGVAGRVILAARSQSQT